MSVHASFNNQADFLFVNYQDDNPQNRSNSLSRQKAVFAQKAHQRKKRIAAVERLKTSKPAFCQKLPFVYDAAPPVYSTLPYREENTKEADSTSEAAREDVLPPHLAILKARQMKDLWSPLSHLGQGFIDPFYTAAVPMSEFMNLYWHHFRQFIIPLAYPLNSSPMGAWWWQQGLSEPVIHQTLLISAASHRLAMDTVNNAPLHNLQRSKREFLRIQGDIIKRLNRLLQHPDTISESITLTIAALRAIEAISCNYDCVAVHTEGLNALIQLHGGIEKLDHQTLWEIYQSDIMYAALTDTVPVRPLITRWRSEILQEADIIYSGDDFVSQLDLKPKVAARLSILGTSFFNASWYTSLSDTMKTLLHVSQRLIQYYEKGQIQPSTVLPTDNSLFLVLGHGLLSVRYPAAQDEDADKTSCALDEPIRITLFIYLNMRIWNFQEYPIMQLLVNRLQASLLRTTSPTSPAPALAQIKNTAPDLLFWILFTGGMAAQGHDVHLWFVHQLVDLAPFLGLREWEMVRVVLGGFFYTDQPDQPRGEALWEQVVLTGLDGLLSTI
ncbi:hypothetical protein BJX64DRAFT_269748 [Aspergillus heterothallicus]